jgi:Family of unknown function (DUF6491)
MRAGSTGKPAIYALLVAILAAGSPAAQSSGQETGKPDVPSDRAAIHFVDYGGIRNWRADRDDALYIEGRNRRWYKATFFGPCHGLRFSDTIGFVSDSGGTVDRFSSIVARGPGHGTMECHFRTFSEVPSPPDSKKAVPKEPETSSK